MKNFNLNEWFATTWIGGFVKHLLGYAIAYLMFILTKNEFESLEGFSWNGLATTVLGAAVTTLYNYFNVKDPRFGKLTDTKANTKIE